MPLQFQRPATIDVTVSNNRPHLYLSDGTFLANETTDGSFRIVITPGEDVIHLEQRANGVWNDTGLRTSPKTLQLGRDLFLKAGYTYIETTSPSGSILEDQTLVPHIQFDDSGTNGNFQVHTPVLDGLENFPLFTTATAEETSTLIDQGFNIGFRRLVKTIVHQLGTTAATEDVQHSIYLGTDNTGFLISQVNTGPSIFVANDALTASTIDSVTDSGGIARFNFSVGVAPVIGAGVRIAGFTTNTAYNTTGDLITATDGSTFFEISSIAFGSDEATGTFLFVWVIDFAYGLGVEANQNIFTEITSAANLSLAVDSGGEVITDVNAQLLAELDIITENRTFDNNLEEILDNNLNPVYASQF